MWRYASLEEAFHIVFACAFSTIVQLITILAMHLPLPRSYYILFFIQLVMAIGAIRFAYRFLRIFLRRREVGYRKDGIRTMIIGAGQGGELVVNEIRNSLYLDHQAVCIIDDDVNKKGTYLHGVKVIGGRDMISGAVEEYQIQEIILAIPSMDYKDRKEILNICKDTGCSVKILPGLY